MTIIKDKNNLDLETLIEFARVGVSLNVSRFTAAPPGTLFDKLRDSLEPSILQDRGDEGDLIRDRNLLFCEPRVLAEDLTTCPACVPDPNAFVPDWRASPDGLIFFDKSKCNYCCVVETDVFNVPKNEKLKEFVELGVQRLIEFYNKTETITAVVYKPYPTFDDLNPKTRTAEERSEINLSENFGVAFIKEFISGKATDPFTIMALPRKKQGFQTYLEEFSSLDELTPVAFEITEVFVPPIRNVQTKILVCIPAEVFDKVPFKTQQPKPSPSAYESDYEITISGSDYVDIFIDVSRNLQRASIYLRNLLEETDGSKLFYADSPADGDPAPYVDFKQKSKNLKDFKKLVDSAIGSAANIGPAFVDKIVFNFTADPQQKTIRIKEVTVNKKGCPIVVLSQFRNSDREVQKLFNYDDSMVLGYVSSLSDMMAMLEKTKEETKWDDFILKFSFPGFVIRDSQGNLVSDEDPECLGGLSLNSIVNKLIDGLEDLGNMFYNTAIQQLCLPQSDLIEMRKARSAIRETVIQALKEFYANGGLTEEELNRVTSQNKNGLSYQKALNLLKKKKKDIVKDYQDSLNLDLENPAAAAAYKSQMERVDQVIQILKENKNLTRKENAKTKKENFEKKFNKSIINKVKMAKRGRLGAKPLAQKILEWIFPGTKEPGANREKRKLDQIFDGLNKGGGWCAWVGLILEGMSCLLNGMGIEDAQKAIAKGILKSLSPVKLQILLRNLPPEISATVIESITENIPTIFPEAFDNPGDGTWSIVHGDSIAKKFIQYLPGFAKGLDENGNFIDPKAARNPWEIDLNGSEGKTIKITKETVVKLPEQKTKNASINDGIKIIIGEGEDSYEFTVDPVKHSDWITKAKQDSDQNRKSAIQARLDAGLVGRTEASALGKIQTQIIGQLIDSLLENVGVNQLISLLEDIPGVRLAQKFVQDIQCLMPPKTMTNPKFDNFLSTFRFDVCTISKGKSVDIKLPRFTMPKISRNVWLKMWESLGEALLDIFTQILINLLVKIIETVLDLFCNALGSIGAYVSELATGNTSFRDQLKETICPNDPISDSAFAEGLKNVLDGLYGSTPDQANCVSQITGQEMASFIDATIVTLNYGELYDLMLGNANLTILETVSAVARGLGSECIANIFGNPTNVENYFKGLGILTDAGSLINEIPPDVELSSSSFLCPADNRDALLTFRSDILSKKGLSPREIQDQLDFLKRQAEKKLEDLSRLLNSGPFPDEISDIFTPDPKNPCSTDSLLVMDPFLDGAIKTHAGTVFSVVETQLMQDLVGFNGIMNHILSDTFGRKYSMHQFYIGFFGNSIGQANHLLTEYYSDNCIRYSFIEGDKLITKDDKKNNSSIDQYGLRVPDGRNEKAPRGGFPPTIGSYLLYKFKNNKIGFIDSKSLIPDATQNFSDLGSNISFKTRRIDPVIISKNEQINKFNSSLIAKRKERIAKFCIAVGFIDAESAQKYIPFPLQDSTIEFTKEIRKKSDFFDRLGAFEEMISACSKPVFSNSLNFSNYSPELRVRKILGQPENPELREISYNGRIYGLASTRKDVFIRQLKNNASEYEGDFFPFMTYSEETMRFYLECWFAYLTQGSTENSQQFYNPFVIGDEQIEPDKELISPITNNPFELGFSYLSYRKLRGNLADKSLSLPEWGFDLTYNLNLEDGNGNLLNEKRNFYQVRLIEKLNPFNDPELLSKKDIAKLNYANFLNNAKGTTGGADDNTVSLESDSIPAFGNTSEIVRFDLELRGSYPVEVQEFIDLADKNINYLDNSNQIISYPSSVYREFMINNLTFDDYLGRKKKFSIFTNQPSYSEDTDFVIESLNSTLNKLKLNKLFEFINEGFNIRISNRIGFGNNTEKIAEYDYESHNPNDIDSYLEPPLPDRSVVVPKGFRFGYDPNKQPEYVILDPSKYGIGDQENPPFYLKPPEFEGWLGIMQSLFPEEDACDPKRKPIYDLDDIQSDVSSLAKKFIEDERFGFDPSCTKESPYDGIFESMNLATMDGIIRATARVYLLDTVLRSVPVLSEFELNADKNFDELFFIYMAEKALDNIKRADLKRVGGPTIKNVQEIPSSNPPIFAFLGDRIPYMNYYYGILEQSVNITIRKLDSGIITMDDLDANQREAVNKIRVEIENYYSKYAGTEAVLSEEAIRVQSIIASAFNHNRLRDIGLKLGSAGFNKFRAKKIKKAINYAVLRKTEEQAKILFSYYMKQEFKALSEKLSKILKPSVEDLDYLFLGSEKFVNGPIKKQLDSLGNEIKDETGNPVVYGAVDVCGSTTDPNRNYINFDNFTTNSDVVNESQILGEKQSPTSTESLNQEKWPFLLEKYIVINDKPIGEFKDPAQASLILGRDSNLKGVVNLNDWDKFIKEFKLQNPGIKGKISDFWGPGIKEVDSNPTSANYGQEYIKNTGWKFGLRLSLVFGKESEFYKLFEPIVNRYSEKIIKENKAYKISTNDGDKILLPIAFGELDIKDREYDRFNAKDYDYFCLVNEMKKSIEFQTLFKFIFPYRRYLTLQTIYLANAFYDSIGNSGAPSSGGDRWSLPGGKRASSFKGWEKDYVFHNQGDITGDTARSLMNTFMMSYRMPASIRKQSKRNKRKFEIDFGSILKNFAIDASIFDVSSPFRRYRLERPYDMNDQECLDFDSDDEEDDY